MIDPAAFTTLEQYKRYTEPVEVYAEVLRHIATLGNIVSATAEDYMCEPFMLAQTGLSVVEHQQLTIERYDALLVCDPPVYILPVIQGYTPADYMRHVGMYGDRLKPGMWVGVGSVCKRQKNPGEIETVLGAILSLRPDLRLHGFGIKTTSLRSAIIYHQLYSADSLAWSSHARKAGRNPNDYREAVAFTDRIYTQPRRPRVLQHPIWWEEIKNHAVPPRGRPRRKETKDS